MDTFLTFYKLKRFFGDPQRILGSQLSKHKLQNLDEENEEYWPFLNGVALKNNNYKNSLDIFQIPTKLL